MLNLDTHIVALLLSRGLTAGEYRRLAEEELAISDIVLWELAMLASRGRLAFDLDDPAFRSFIEDVTVIPITLEIARRSTQLDFHADPADHIVAATSVVEKLPLLTRDRRIRKSHMVPLAL